MRSFQSFGYLEGEFQRFFNGDWAGFYLICERSALDQFKHDADRRGAILLSVQSSGRTWAQRKPTDDETDVANIKTAISELTVKAPIDRGRTTLAINTAVSIREVTREPVVIGLNATPGSNCHDFVPSKPSEPRSVTSNTARCRGSVETCTCAKLYPGCRTRRTAAISDRTMSAAQANDTRRTNPNNRRIVCSSDSYSRPFGARWGLMSGGEAHMDAIEALKTRRSIRLYLAKPVPKEIIEDIIDCGRLAPTARGEEPCEFIVVTDADTRR